MIEQLTTVRGVINQQYQLEIMANNRILVPGCEPTSAISNVRSSPYNPAKAFCDQAMVDVKHVLAAIPGSTIKYGSNFSKGGSRQRWLVLPPSNYDCPSQLTDYYKILKTLPYYTAPVEEVNDLCGVFGMGSCPSPEFNQEPCQPSPYVREDCPPKCPAGPVGPPGPPGPPITKLDQLVDVVAPKPAEYGSLRYVDGAWRDVPNIVDGGEF